MCIAVSQAAFDWTVSEVHTEKDTSVWISLSVGGNSLYGICPVVLLSAISAKSHRRFLGGTNAYNFRNSEKHF